MASAIVLVNIKLVEAGLSPKEANDLVIRLLEEESNENLKTDGDQVIYHDCF